MEIGSIYEIDPASLKGYNADNEQKVSLGELGEIKKYNKKYHAYTASGREAIALALKSLSKCRSNLSKRCLLPAYMCDTVFFPFEHEGWELYFYHVNKELKVNKEELRTQIEKVKPELLFIHPYYGVDTWKELRPWLMELKNQDICIMEDVTQSYYLEGAGAEADYVIGSLRKWYPVPDGGFVASDEKLIEEAIKEDKEHARMRLGVLMDKWNYFYGDQAAEEKKVNKETYLKRNRELEGLLDEYSGIRRISDETAHILERENEDEAKKQRNENYRYLYDGLCKKLKNRAWFEPIISASKEEYENFERDGDRCQSGTDDENYQNRLVTAPLYFAIYADDRDGLQSFLTARGIYAPVLWPIGKENEGCLTADERYIFEHMLALPMDQRYGREEMEYIVETMEAYGTDELEIVDECEADVIGIRADVNDEVGMGHIMRCITIARQIKKLGKSVIFFTADEYGKELLEQAGMEWDCLHSEWNHMEDEVAILKDALNERNCHKLLVDSYLVSIKYFQELSELCKLTYIDDCFEEIYPVDMIINYNAYHVRFNYKEAYHNKAQLLLGTAYVPLREEFQGGHIAEDLGEFKQDCISGGSSDVCNQILMSSGGSDIHNQVLISCGGGDVYNALAGVLNKTVEDEELSEVIFHTVVGKFNPNTEELKRLEKEHENIKLHYDVKNMAELMATCDAAVSAAGTMLFELSAMQVPTVFFVCADNQQYDNEFFAKGERMLFAGDIRADRDGCIENICVKLKMILKDSELQCRMKKALYEVTDGKGAERIAKAIVEL
ncbi:MAG: UDP-2,4-diacetamido-2,4,6-trideoxy-beta-L-altropyranose hydrolase [Lachnospiraceae bacterium]|nr:UDP-2,4-diacetamido-2,4,6-trideoxy-beta-L-altropyranose hydrolase [Lachnospiraceae bacterium]